MIIEESMGEVGLRGGVGKIKGGKRREGMKEIGVEKERGAKNRLSGM